MFGFEQPLLLLLLLPVGLLTWLAWRRLALPFSRAQRRFIVASRIALFVLVIAGLAEPVLAMPEARQAVIFVGDISASTLAQQGVMAQWIDDAIRQKRPGDSVGIVAVGRNALVEQSLSTSVSFSQFQTTPDTSYTDLAAGLRLAAALLPENSERRIVLLSDGQQNLEDALPEARLLRQEGIRLDVVPLPAVTGPEARVDNLTAPSSLRSGERFVLHASLYSTVAQNVTLRLYLDQALLLQRTTHLAVGEQEISFDLPAPSPGFHSYRLSMDAALDTISQNNQATAFVSVQGPPQVLIIEGQPGAGANIAAALKATHISVTVGAPADVPPALDGLASYEAVVLADVPAADLGQTRMQVLQAYVRDLGRGLVVSGGEHSFGLGGYAGTPLEATLPVSMDIPQHKDNPTIAVALIVESLETNATINVSKEAAKGVVSLLTPRDYIGVSDANGGLNIPMQHVTDKVAIDQAIDAMNPNDPASYMSDLLAAEKSLLKTNAKIKHIILLGDGDATDTYSAEIGRLASEHITVSVVGTNISSFQDLTMMQQIAQVGKGRFYRADDPNAIPQILLDETKQAAKRAIIEQPFVPAIVGPHPILAGIGALPQLNGYVATTPKPAAQLVLTSPLDDPVLAAWQYGLGRAVAWTSDALGLWTANWLRWNDAARWWANLVTWTLPPPGSQLIINGHISGGNARISVDLPPGVSATTDSGGQNTQQVQVRIVAPDLSQASLMLQPTAPGHWEGSFPTGQVGVYLLRATWRKSGAGKNATASQLSSTTGLVVPYSPEFLTEGTDLNFLARLAQAGGGALLGLDTPAAAFADNLPPVSTNVSLTFWLFALAALLLPIDIALRRLSSLEFVAAGYRWLAARLRPRKKVIESDNIALGAIRAHRQERRSRSVGTIEKAETAGRNAGVATMETEPRKNDVPTASKRGGTGNTTSKLLEEKRKRSGGKSFPQL